jgi:hypothetical protein
MLFGILNSIDHYTNLYQTTTTQNKTNQNETKQNKQTEGNPISISFVLPASKCWIAFQFLQ